MRRRSAPTVIEADSRTDGSPPPHPAGDEERRGAVTPPYGSTTGGAQQPRAIPQSRLRRASSCCGAQNSLLAYAHRILTTATPFCSLLPPLAALANVPLYTREPLGRGDADCRVASLLAMTVLNLCHSEEAQRADVGIRPFYDGRGFGPPYLGHGLRRPNFVPKFGASVRSSAPTEGQRCNSGLPASEQGCSPCIPGPGRRPPHCGSRHRSSLFAKGFDPLPDS